MVWNYQNADCSLRKKIIVSYIIIFGTLSFPINLQCLPKTSSHIFVNNSVKNRPILIISGVLYYEKIDVRRKLPTPHTENVATLPCKIKKKDIFNNKSSLAFRRARVNGITQIDAQWNDPSCLYSAAEASERCWHCGGEHFMRVGRCIRWVLVYC